MGLYLCIFENDATDDELDGVEVGSYAYFGALRDIIAEHLENGAWASRFPTLMNHADADGIWTASECRVLADELSTIRTEMRQLSPPPLPEPVQSVVSEYNLTPANLADCFVDVDGTPLLDRLVALAATGAEAGLSIWLQ